VTNVLGLLIILMCYVSEVRRRMRSLKEGNTETLKKRLSVVVCFLCILQVIVLAYSVQVVHYNKETARMLKGNVNEWFGVYFDDWDMLLVYTQDGNARRMQMTSMHEICHFLWLQKLSSSETKQYKEIYAAAEFVVSEQAKKDAYEDFADSCAYWVMGRQIPKEREQFMEQHVWRYVERIHNGGDSVILWSKR
jgi:Zn-dependent peptidase ImmA (M78 family)